jgi:polyphosphate kinase
LTVNLELSPYQVYSSTGPLGLADLGQLASLEVPQLKFPVFVPTVRRGAQPTEDIFKRIAAGDIVLYHPYDSFDTVLEFDQAGHAIWRRLMGRLRSDGDRGSAALVQH